MKPYAQHIRNIVRLSEKYKLAIRVKNLIKEGKFGLNKKDLLGLLKILKIK